MARSQATQGTQPGPFGAAAERSPAFRFAFLQILMQRGYMPEADAKALYRRLCSVNSGATGGRAQSWVPQPRRATRPPARLARCCAACCGGAQASEPACHVVQCAGWTWRCQRRVCTAHTAARRTAATTAAQVQQPDTAPRPAAFDCAADERYFEFLGDINQQLEYAHFQLRRIKHPVGGAAGC